MFYTLYSWIASSIEFIANFGSITICDPTLNDVSAIRQPYWWNMGRMARLMSFLVNGAHTL